MSGVSSSRGDLQYYCNTYKAKESDCSVPGKDTKFRNMLLYTCIGLNSLLYRGHSLQLYDAKVFKCTYRHILINFFLFFGSVGNLNTNYSSVYLQLYDCNQTQSSKASCRTARKSQSESKSTRYLQSLYIMTLLLGRLYLEQSYELKMLA